MRVHPCRLQLVKPTSRTTTTFKKQDIPQSQHTHEQEYAGKQSDQQERFSDSDDEQTKNNPYVSQNNTETPIDNPTPQQLTSNIAEPSTHLTPVDKITPKTKIEYKITADDDWNRATVIN